MTMSQLSNDTKFSGVEKVRMKILPILYVHPHAQHIFEDKNSLHFWDPNERFGTHAKLSWGARLVKVTPGLIAMFTCQTLCV